MKHVVCNGLIAVLMLGGSSMVQAQSAEPMGVFVNVSAGGQAPQRTIDTSVTFPLYGQDASVASAQNVGRGGIFDINGGYPLKKLGVHTKYLTDLSIGAGFTNYSKTGDIVGAASIPHPLFVDQARSVELNGSGKRTERSFYIQAVWFMPLDRFASWLDKADLAFSIGPSFISVSQDVFGEPSVPSGTQDVNANIVKAEDTAVGLLAAVDATYLVTPRIGVGAFVRYHGAGGVDLSPAEKQSTGGFQGGGGVRFRF
jgi:hypothetical protein